jgi:formylglycine-generating enzyme required for sulfatase activity
MAGNVAEWTKSAYDESSYRFTHDLSPDYQYNARPDEPAVMKRKVTRGGSWKDAEYFLRVSTRTYEYQDSATSYIGFRCIRDFLGNTTR